VASVERLKIEGLARSLTKEKTRWGTLNAGAVRLTMPIEYVLLAMFAVCDMRRGSVYRLMMQEVDKDVVLMCVGMNSGWAAS
jgi:hypothetical protein